MAENAAISYNPNDESNVPDPFQAALIEAQHQFLSRAGIEGIGQGKTKEGRDAIVVFARDKQSLDQLPLLFRGYPVVGQVSGEIKIF